MNPKLNDITLRDCFAIEAMNALIISAGGATDPVSPEIKEENRTRISTSAYRMADAMLIARNKRP
jgi:hypothetical protein